MNKYILIISILIIGGGVFYFSTGYKHEECTIQVFGFKGELFEKMKKECKKINVLDKGGNLIEVIEN